MNHQWFKEDWKYERKKPLQTEKLIAEETEIIQGTEGKLIYPDSIRYHVSKIKIVFPKKENQKTIKTKNMIERVKISIHRHM